MTSGSSPEDAFQAGPAAGPAYSAAVVAERLLADPGRVRQRLDADVDEVTKLGREPVRLDPASAPAETVAAVRAAADRIGFGSLVAAAAAARSRIAELPYGQRQGGEPIEAYHASAARTVADGELVRESLTTDGGADLVFHRLAEEPARTTVRLEAVVRVAGDGLAAIRRYGWPDLVAQSPVFDFAGSASGYLDELVASLQTARTAGDQAERGVVASAERDARAAGDWFEQAMLMALGSLIAQSRDGWLPDERLVPYQKQVLTLLSRAPVLLLDYLDGAYQWVERDDAVGFTGGCLRRSACEALFSGFLGAATFELVDGDALGELDRTLTELAARLRATGVRLAPPPQHLPSWHDWWTGAG